MNNYEVGKLLVNNQEYCSLIIVFPKKVIELKESGVNSRGHFVSFLIKEVKVLLIGTGKICKMTNTLVKAYLIEQKGLNLEFMTTGIAGRERNILVSEADLLLLASKVM
ncbi:MTH938/NDUFAF3 family protein [Wolbachia endosymbiont of Dirofilaria (Dirofilaria) immitis]|uniref:MTH938/NDUFAF3 family protein n=1 Tax=Wolbachia endosymbiont of Dirofilaria (Dirofilaria) immitis TaxID=1812115 RepID=UPI001FED1C7A|nr:MTH938/NDUFAF3 family protein [Wolbachia endosymbiont of Dirofilaria (Dirofilaria) immitis]